MNLVNYNQNNLLSENADESDLSKSSNKQVAMLSSWNLLEYISSLSEENVNVIFNSVSCVVELFSSLSELQQQIVSRLMAFGTNKDSFIGEKAMNLWVIPSKQTELTDALKNLRSLKIIKANISNSVNQKSLGENIILQYHLNNEFQKTLSKYICNGIVDIGVEMLEKVPELEISYISLTNFVRQQWNNILNIIVELSGYAIIEKSNNCDIFKDYKVISKDLFRTLDKINLIYWKPSGDLFRIGMNNSKTFKINIEPSSTQNDNSGQLYDGFDEEDYSITLKEQQYFDIYNDIEYGMFDMRRDLSDDEYLPNNIKLKKTKKIVNSRNNLNNPIKQMDKIFEQKLAPKAFRWLLCDTCNQLLVLLNGFIKILEEDSNQIENIDDQLSKDKKKNILDPKIAGVISLIFRLSSSKIGQPIFINNEARKNNLLLRFILFAYDLGLIYIEKEVLKYNVYPYLNKEEFSKIPNIEIIYTTPYSILISSDGYKLQSLYSTFKITSDCLGNNKEKIEDLLLPSHFYYNEKMWLSNKEQEVLCKEVEHAKKHCAKIEAGIIVQSNFRIYCYTASPLQAKILRHLCQVKVRGPNIISGILTRKGLLSAYSMGVTAEQILRFFFSNAHPMVLKRYMMDGTNIIPVGVETQLKLWEKDKNRLTIIPATTFSGWGSSQKDIQLYNQTVLYAINRNIALYYIDTEINEEMLNGESPNSIKDLVLIIKEEYEDDIKTFIRTKRELLNS